MDEELRQERSVVARPEHDKSLFRLWIIPASLLFHILLAAIFLVQWPQRELNAAPEEVVSLSIVPEPEAKPEEPAAPETAQEPKEEASEPPPPPPQGEAEEPAEEPPAEPAILPDIAIRPGVETQLDATDNQEQPEPQSKVPEVSDEVPAQPVEVPQSQAEPDDVQQGFGEPTTSGEGELPTGELAPVPTIKPSQVITEEKPLEERKPLANEVIEQSGLRQILGDLPPRRRLNQICTIEAISQIRASNEAYASVRGVIPASDAGLTIKDGHLSARGGAFNLGNGRWVAIDFECEADLDNYRVLRFSQKIGRELSRSEVRTKGFDRFE